MVLLKGSLMKLSKVTSKVNVMLKFLKSLLKVFPKWRYFTDKGERFRENVNSGNIQAYSSELCKWVDLEYLHGTNFDGGIWILYKFSKSF